MNKPSKPRVVFAGTPEFSVPSLQALIDADVEVIAVYTQPDRPAGRGKQLQASPVKTCALAAGLPVIQPQSLRQSTAQDEFLALNADLMVVTAYGLILSKVILHAPRLGCVNIHASLLPRWRGAAPIQRAIQAGDTETGITLMQMDVGLDTGDMLASVATTISDEDTGGSLHDRLSLMGGTCLAEHLPAVLAGSLKPVSQDNTQACYANKLDKAEAKLDWSQSARDMHNHIRAFNPWPVATTELHQQTLRVFDAAVANSPPVGAIGEVVSSDQEGIGVQTGEGVLLLRRLQKPGGRPLAVRDFINGFSINVGDHFI